MPSVDDEDFSVELYWEPYDTQLYAAKLMRHTQKHETRFSYDANPGSLESAFVVGILANGGYDLIVNQAKYLLKRKRAAENAGRIAPPPELTINIDFPDIDIGPLIDMSENIDQDIYVPIEDEKSVEEVKRVAEAMKERSNDDQ